MCMNLVFQVTRHLFLTLLPSSSSLCIYISQMLHSAHVYVNADMHIRMMGSASVLDLIYGFEL